MLLVWDVPGPSEDALHEALVRATRGQVERSSIEVEDQRTCLARWDLGAWLPGSVASFGRSPMGFAFLTLTWSANAFAKTGQAAAAAVEFAACTLAEATCPRFGYATLHATFLENEHIEEAVFVPLLTDDDDQLMSGLYYLAIVGSEQQAPLPTPRVKLAGGPFGVVVRLCEHVNPLGPDDEL